MALSEQQRLRFARHLLLPELGELGVTRLLAGSVRFVGGADEEARGVAEEYLRRAGVAVGEEGNAHAHAHAHADEHEHEHEHVNVNVNVNVDVVALRSHPALAEAGRALSGAFAAVEAIKAVAGLGAPARLELDLLSAEDV